MRSVAIRRASAWRQRSSIANVTSRKHAGRNGTVNNNSGTFEWMFEPPCIRTAPYCKIATRLETGTFKTSGSSLELDYDNGAVSHLTAQADYLIDTIRRPSCGANAYIA